MSVAYVNSANFLSNFSNTVSGSFDAGGGGSPTGRGVIAIIWSAGSTVSTGVGVTFAGTAMTFIDGYTSAGAPVYTYQAYLLLDDANIPTGSQTVTGTFSGSTASIHATLSVHSFSGVDAASSATIIASVLKHATTSQSPSWTISSASGDLATAIFTRLSNGHTLTPGSGVTTAFDSGTGSFNSDPFVVFTKAGASSVVLNGTLSGSGDQWWGFAVTLPHSGGPASAITLSGPGSGTINVTSSNFTAGVDATPITGTVIVTPATDLTGTFAPTTVSLTTGSPTGTFTFTPTAVGAHTITTTNNGSLTNSPPLTFIAASLYNPYNGPSVFQPTVAQ